MLAGLVPGILLFSDSTNSIYTRRNVNLYVIDLELGRSYFVSKSLSLRPTIGEQSTAWIYQKVFLQTEQLNLENTFSPMCSIMSSSCLLRLQQN